jgi:hypothetical protein
MDVLTNTAGHVEYRPVLKALEHYLRLRSEGNDVATARRLAFRMLANSLTIDGADPWRIETFVSYAAWLIDRMMGAHQ